LRDLSSGQFPALSSLYLWQAIVDKEFKGALLKGYSQIDNFYDTKNGQGSKYKLFARNEGD